MIYATHAATLVFGASAGLYAGGALYHHRLKAAMRRTRCTRQRVAADELAHLVAELADE